jgi:hypothetical protein
MQVFVWLVPNGFTAKALLNSLISSADIFAFAATPCPPYLCFPATLMGSIIGGNGSELSFPQTFGRNRKVFVPPALVMVGCSLDCSRSR